MAYMECMGYPSSTNHKKQGHWRSVVFSGGGTEGPLFLAAEEPFLKDSGFNYNQKNRNFIRRPEALALHQINHL